MSSQTYAHHPIAETIPRMTAIEYVELREDIRYNGLVDDITLFEGMILDGRHRFEACEETCHEPRFVQFRGTFDEAKAFVISKNKRRHLSEGQRAMVAAQLANLGPGRPSEQTASTDAVISQTKAAEMLNVSRESVQRAAKVLKDGVPELKELVDSSKISVSKAASVASEPKPKQRRIAKILAGGGNVKIASAATRVRVESHLKHARVTFDLCLIDNPSIVKNKVNIIAMLHFLALKLEQDANPEAREGARYIKRMIEDWEETDAVGEVHDMEEAIYKALFICPQEFKDLQKMVGCAPDELRFTLDLLMTNRWVETTHQEGKTEEARGQKKTLYRLTLKGRQEFDRLVALHAA